MNHLSTGPDNMILNRQNEHCILFFFLEQQVFDTALHNELTFGSEQPFKVQELH